MIGVSTIQSKRAIWIAFVFGIAVGIGVMRSCDVGTSANDVARFSVRTTRTVVHDTVPVEFSPLHTEVRIVREQILLPIGSDTVELMRAIAMRDSLATLLAAARVRLPFHGDTVLSDSRDSVSIECDEINRSARLRVRYALRHVQVDRTVDSVSIDRTLVELPAWTVDIGAGMTLGLDGTARPALYIGISKPLFGIRP